MLFPETFSVAERPPSTTSARSSATARPSASAASPAAPPRCCSSTCRPTPPACSPRRSSRENAYILWDLIHDRTHMRGDLPFDPFMIRQRSPYWMYALEELRCDLTAFGDAVELEREGFAFARYVQYAILFDRLFRFPITGTRVRNYDGLGGQLLFAFLHKRGLPALDRQPPDDRLGPRRRRRRRPARARPGALPLRHRPLEARPVDRRPRPRLRVRRPDRELRLGGRQARPARGRRAQAARRPRPRRRVPAEPLLRAAAAEDAGGAGAPARGRPRGGTLRRAQPRLRLRP